MTEPPRRLADGSWEVDLPKERMSASGYNWHFEDFLTGGPMHGIKPDMMGEWTQLQVRSWPTGLRRPRVKTSELMGMISKAARFGAKPKPLLADQAQNPSAWTKFHGKKLVSPIATTVRQMERVVLDDEATKLVTRTAHTDPKQIARMCELAVSPYDKLWVEMSYAAMEEEIKEHTPMGRRYTHPDERIAFLYENREDAVLVRIVQHEDGNPKSLHEWPVAFIISNTGEPLETKGYGVAYTDAGNVEVRVQGKVDALRQTAVIWGYTLDRPGLKKLRRLAEVTALDHHAKPLMDLGIDPVRTAQRCVAELAGIPRRAVALLALMNTTIVQMGERSRPPGRFLGRGGVSKPYLERTTTVLNIPHRVRMIDQYVEKEIRDEVSRIRKRRHHVKGHFRHLSYEPVNGDGWVPCFCPGREPGRYWHRYIHEHDRGDESLGIVEHDYVIVRGETETVE